MCTPATQLIAVAPLREHLYVVANFKETQLRRMQPGMKVRLIPDIDCSAAVDGRVDSLAPATGALFSLLPPENATGNFTKVVQRVPVKLVLDPAEGRACRLAARGPVGHRRGRYARPGCPAPRPVRHRRRDAGAHRAMTAATDRLSWRQWVGFMAMVLGMFMAILDIQIVSASISDIQAGLAASPDEASWVQTSYLIAEIVMIPLSGWLSRLLSTRVLFVASALGFTLFSLACAGASSLGEMVVFRAAQGFIGGAMIPTVFATTFLLFPGEKRTQMSVLIGLTATMAPTIGPTLGGWLTDQYSWHWLFLINVPVGLVVAGAVWTCLDIDKPDWSLRRGFDMIGLTLMALFLGALEYVLEEGDRWDWFQDETIAWCGVISVVAGVLFFWRMLTRRDPLVELRAFANVNFAFGSLFSFVLGIGLYGSVYLVPLFLGRVRGYDSLQIGETMFVTGAAMFLSAPIAGQLARVLDLRVMLAIGLLMFGGGLWWMAELTVDFGVLGAVRPAGAARRLDDADHAAGQPDRARPTAAGGAEECIGPLQPDAQSRWGGRAGNDQHGGNVAARRAHAASAGAGDLVALRGNARARQHDACNDRGEVGRCTSRGAEAGGNDGASPGADTELQRRAAADGRVLLPCPAADHAAGEAGRRHGRGALMA